MTISVIPRTKTTELTNVLLFVRYPGGVFKYTLGFKVNPKHLREGTILRHDPDAEIKNRIIEDYIRSVQKLFIEASELNQTVDNDYLRSGLQMKHQNTTASKVLLLEYVDRFVQQAPMRVNSYTGKPLSIRTIYKYKDVQKALTQFEMKKGIKFQFEHVDTHFYHEWINFLQQRDYSTNTVGKYIKTLKEFLNRALKERVTTWQEHRLGDFKVLHEDVLKVYLSEKELDTIWKLTKLEPNQEQARDLFLIGCWTGLRVSDYLKLTKSHIRDNTIFLQMAKTGDSVVIPLHPVAQAILEKYNYVLPSTNGQKLNKYTKEVVKLAGITELIGFNRTMAGKKVTYNKPKYELVSSHTGRRSFATNLYLSGFPAYEIMKITGHKTEQAFLQYLKVSKEQAAEKLRQHWQNSMATL